MKKKKTLIKVLEARSPLLVYINVNYVQNV